MLLIYAGYKIKQRIKIPPHIQCYNILLNAIYLVLLGLKPGVKMLKYYRITELAKH